MRLKHPQSIARFGEIEIRGVQEVVELEAHETSPSLHGANNTVHNNTQAVSFEDLQAVQARTAIVVPCKDEAIDRMRGVWAAIPANSLIIVVSGSKAEAYLDERDALATFCAVTRRSGMCVHQWDPQLAAVLREVGMGALLDDDGLVYKGKGEGMVIGTMLAAIARGPTRQNGTVAFNSTDRAQGSAPIDNHVEIMDRGTIMQGDNDCLCATTHGNVQLACRRYRPANTMGYMSASGVEARLRKQAIRLPGYYSYVGFIDADNYVPGSVQEYCKAFSAGLALADADDAMVRLSWAAKPKVKNGRLVFKPSGRSSQIVNLWLNRLLRIVNAKMMGDDIGGDEGDEEEMDDEERDREPGHICTGNAGEHAMSMSLALKLRLANGYAIEPFHFLDIFERLVGGANMFATGGLSKDKLKRVVSGYTSQSTLPSISPLSSPLLSSSIRPSGLVTSGPKILPRPCFSYSSDSGSFGSSRNSEEDSPLPSLTTFRAVDETAAPDITDITPPGSPAFPSSAIAPAKVQILQVRTLNSHFHDNKGDVHVVRMWQQGLSAIYHSPLTATLTKYRHNLRTAIFAGDSSVGKIANGLPTPPATNCASVAVTPPDVSVEEEDRGINGAAVEAAASWQPETCRIYPAPESVDLISFRNRLEAGECGSFWWSGGDSAGSKSGLYGP